MTEPIIEGMGRPILVVHGGMGDSTSWAGVTDLLRDKYRTIRVHRLQYQLDVPRKVTIADEVEQVRTAAAGLDRPVLVGHSSGAVVVLEALAADPGAYSGAVLYEPPLMLDEPVGGEKLDPARAALDAGKPAAALTIFLREAVGLNRLISSVAGFAMGRDPEMRGRVQRQLDDVDAIDALGKRLTAYRKITVPVLLIGGDKSPAHLAERLDALQAALPRTRRLRMHGQGHNAERLAPDRLAKAIAHFVDEDLYPAHR